MSIIMKIGILSYILKCYSTSALPFSMKIISFIGIAYMTPIGKIQNLLKVPRLGTYLTLLQASEGMSLDKEVKELMEVIEKNNGKAYDNSSQRIKEVCDYSLLTLVQFYHDQITDNTDYMLESSKSMISFMNTKNYVSKNKIKDELARV